MSAQVAWGGGDLAPRGRGGGVGVWEGSVWLDTWAPIGPRNVLETTTGMPEFGIKILSQGWESPWTRAPGSCGSRSRAAKAAAKVDGEAIANVIRC